MLKNIQKSLTLKSLIGGGVALLLALTLTSCSSAESSSETEAVGYRYWGYSQSSDDGTTWNTAMEGPATTNPKDGSVEGWNYTFSADGVVDPQAPSAAPDFQKLCGSTAQEEGKKRVGYVIEFGDPVIYPEGDSAPAPSSGCASIPVDGTGMDLLNAVAEVRAGEGGFICGLNGFPTKDCGADAIPVPESMRKK